MLPSSVKRIQYCAFGHCKRLQLVDLSAVRDLQHMESSIFRECKKLKRALLGDGLKTISNSCFEKCGLEEIVIP